MPLNFLEQITFKVNHGLRPRREALWVLFLHGNESLGLRVPGYDRVVWNPDLWDELQRHPIQELGHRQASLDENLSALDALGQVQARIWIDDGGVITARQLVGHMVELGRRLVGLPKRTSQSPGREEEIEVAGFVSNDHHDLPAASVQVPLSPRRVGPAPDRTEFRGGPQAPFDREPQVFQQSRDVLPNELSLILGANEER